MSLIGAFPREIQLIVTFKSLFAAKKRYKLQSSSVRCVTPAICTEGGGGRGRRQWACLNKVKRTFSALFLAGSCSGLSDSIKVEISVGKRKNYIFTYSLKYVLGYRKSCPHDAKCAKYQQQSGSRGAAEKVRI